jgi:hypothetical protein
MFRRSTPAGQTRAESNDSRVSTLDIRSVGPTRCDLVMAVSLVDAGAQPGSYVPRKVLEGAEVGRL